MEIPERYIILPDAFYTCIVILLIEARLLQKLLKRHTWQKRKKLQRKQLLIQTIKEGVSSVEEKRIQAIPGLRIGNVEATGHNKAHIDYLDG